MELLVKVIKVFEPRVFKRKDGTDLVRNSFLGEYHNGNFAHKVVFDVMNNWDKMGIVAGQSYTVSFDVSSREWNGRYYTSLTVWKAVRVNDGAVQISAPSYQGDDENAPF